MGEKEKWNDFNTMKRGGARGTKAERNSLPFEAMVKSRPMVLLSAMSGSLAMQQQVSVWMFVVHITFKGHEDVPGRAAA